MRRKARAPHESLASVTEWDGRLFDEAVARLREQFAAPPAGAPTQEDIAALQEALASHKLLVESIAEWRKDAALRRHVGRPRVSPAM